MPKVCLRIDGEVEDQAEFDTEPEDFLDKPVDPVKLIASVKAALS
ncbi:MAG: hypothetical protein ACLFWL_17755 [Candidatus Brocadiia bacterium]